MKLFTLQNVLRRGTPCKQSKELIVTCNYGIAEDRHVDTRINLMDVPNMVVDLMLKAFQSNKAILERLTPLVINEEINFGNGRLHDLKVFSLPNLRRNGNVTLSYDAGSVFATLGGGLSVDQLFLTSKYSYKPVGVFNLKGEIDALLTGPAARIMLTVHMRNASANLNLFKVGFVSRFLCKSKLVGYR